MPVSRPYTVACLCKPILQTRKMRLEVARLRPTVKGMGGGDPEAKRLPEGHWSISGPPPKSYLREVKLASKA